MTPYHELRHRLQTVEREGSGGGGGFGLTEDRRQKRNTEDKRDSGTVGKQVKKEEEEEDGRGWKWEMEVEGREERQGGRD